MKKWILLLVVFVQFSFVLSAQTDGWKTEKTKDGQITVQSKVSRQTGNGGKSEQLFEFISSTVVDVPIQKFITLMKDVSMHKDFNDDKESRIVRTISENEWIIYYYSKVPWPFSDFDAVYRMKFQIDNSTNTGVFTLIAEPDSYEKGKVERITSSDLKYEFRALETGKTAITVTAATYPTSIVPDWMVRLSFPDGPADMLSKMIKLAKEKA